MVTNFELQQGQLQQKRRRQKTIILHFNLSDANSYDQFRKDVKRPNILEWIGLRHSVPFDLRNSVSDPNIDISKPSFKAGVPVLLMLTKKSRNYILFPHS